MRFLHSSRLGLSALVALALAAAIPAASAQPAKSPSPAALASAKELIGVIGAGQLFNPLIAGVVEQSKLLYLQQDPGLSKDLNEIAAKMRTDLQPRFGQLMEEVSHLYATHFTEQELKDILAFYHSTSGQKLLAEQPKVIDSSMKYAQTWANKLSEEVTAKMRDELKKKGHAL